MTHEENTQSEGTMQNYPEFLDNWEELRRRVIQKMFSDSSTYILNLLKLRVLNEISQVDYDDKFARLERSYEQEVLGDLKRDLGSDPHEALWVGA